MPSSWRAPGCDVALVDVADCSSTGDAIRELGRTAEAFAVDVLDAEAVDRVVRDAAQRLGGLDVAVNTVGGTHAPKPFLELTVAEWHDVIDRNALGVVPLLPERGRMDARARRRRAAS